ncbi:hypothetical protein G6F61_014796 [Rhizopus arrhizus]|nr:hypothetical protein G6F61_014796 [Rhizopus arrhizus]
MPQSAKSLTLRVARLAPRDRAIPAIIASNWLTGLPIARRSAAISAYASAASPSKLRTCPARSDAKIASTARKSASRR